MLPFAFHVGMTSNMDACLKIILYTSVVMSTGSYLVPTVDTSKPKKVFLIWKLLQFWKPLFISEEPATVLSGRFFILFVFYRRIQGIRDFCLTVLIS